MTTVVLGEDSIPDDLLDMIMYDIFDEPIVPGLEEIWDYEWRERVALLTTWDRHLYGPGMRD